MKTLFHSVSSSPGGVGEASGYLYLKFGALFEIRVGITAEAVGAEGGFKLPAESVAAASTVCRNKTMGQYSQKFKVQKKKAS